MKNTELSQRKSHAIARGVGMTTQVYADRAENSEIWDVEGQPLHRLLLGHRGASTPAIAIRA